MPYPFVDYSKEQADLYEDQVPPHAPGDHRQPHEIEAEAAATDEPEPEPEAVEEASDTVEMDVAEPDTTDDGEQA